MNWASSADFLAMGGYGPFVWGSFGMCLAVVALETAVLWLRRRSVHRSAAMPDGDAGSGA